MNRTQQRTLAAIFAEPVATSLEWRKIEALLLALGARRIPGAGSRVRFECNGTVAVFHRPHPGKEAKPYQVRDAREFLRQAGVVP
ncbi:MAG: type II toxin-antitoxin system HicA family toxin [Lysobacterales bacterium]